MAAAIDLTDATDAVLVVAAAVVGLLVVMLGVRKLIKTTNRS